MFRWLQKRPGRGIVFKLGEDDKFRWQCVRMPLEDEGKDCVEEDKELHRTVFVDVVSDGYPNVKHTFADAVNEVERWCPRNKVSWWLYSEAGVFLRCHLSGDTIILPNQEEAQTPND